MISENQSPNEQTRKLLQMLAIRNQIFVITCTVIIATAWSDTYRLMGQIFALLIVIFLTQMQINIRLGTETNGFITTRTLLFHLLSSAAVGLLIGAFFRTINQPPVTSLAATESLIPLIISTVFLSLIARIRTAAYYDRGIVWSVYAGISLFFAFAVMHYIDSLG